MAERERKRRKNRERERKLQRELLMGRQGEMEDGAGKKDNELKHVKHLEYIVSAQ